MTKYNFSDYRGRFCTQFLQRLW